MPWIFVTYALCTTLADHPHTQTIVRTTCLCPKREAKVKVAAPWQTFLGFCFVLFFSPVNSWDYCFTQGFHKFPKTDRELLTHLIFLGVEQSLVSSAWAKRFWLAIKNSFGLFQVQFFCWSLWRCTAVFKGFLWDCIKDFNRTRNWISAPK